MNFKSSKRLDLTTTIQLVDIVLFGVVDTLLHDRCGTSQSTPFVAQRLCWHTASCPPHRGSASSLAHRPLSGSDTICNNSSPVQVEILSTRFLKQVC